MKSKTTILLDILHIYCSPVVAQFPKSAKKNLYASGFFSKLKSSFHFIGRHIKEQLDFNRSSKTELTKKLSEKHWLFILGTNNYNSINFLEKTLDNFIYVSPYRFQKEGMNILQLRNPRRFTFFLKDLFSLFSILIKNSKNCRLCWDAGFRAAGSYESAKLLLESCRPASIVFSNDHTIEARSYALAAKALGIPTFFIQHACIRPDFPPLKFSLNLLEGKDALEKYKISGPVEGDVKLIGVPRIDPYIHQKNKSEVVKRIGICSNTIDSLKAIETTLKNLVRHFPNHIISYRPHPADKRKLDIEDKTISVSNSRKENPFEFLIKQDLVIAGNTSIHYEAAILNVVPVYFKFDDGGKTDDMYDFVKNGLVSNANSIDELIEIIKRNSVQKEKLNDKANYYHALLNTDKEGSSEKIAAQSIMDFLKK